MYGFDWLRMLYHSSSTAVVSCVDVQSSAPTAHREIRLLVSISGAPSRAQALIVTS